MASCAADGAVRRSPESNRRLVRRQQKAPRLPARRYPELLNNVRDLKPRLLTAGRRVANRWRPRDGARDRLKRVKVIHQFQICIGAWDSLDSAIN